MDSLIGSGSSPGPIIFKQRRYGLDGHEILVYKFRSMRVCDDGDVIKQAGRCDPRIQYDIDTMRNGSLIFGLMIIGKTLAVV